MKTKHKKNTPPPQPKEPGPIMRSICAALRERAPSLLSHMRRDGDWLWYCGPSLKEYPQARAILKELGFRFAKFGHQIKGTKFVGTWGHSCDHPTRFKRRHTPESTTTQAEPASQPIPDVASEVAELDL